MAYKPFHPPHFYIDQATYFVSARTFNNVPVLASDAHKRLFRELLREKIKAIGVRLFAWVILSDHYHLLFYVDEGVKIGRFLKHLHGASSRRLNELDKQRGRRVWRNYWDRCPRDEKEFWAYFNYIHINPIKHRVVPTDGPSFQSLADSALTNDIHALLQSYEFSSYHYYWRRYGEEWFNDLWEAYPIPDYLRMWDEQDALFSPNP